MKKFFSILLIVFLSVIIIGGIGFIGYNALLMKHSANTNNNHQQQTQENGDSQQNNASTTNYSGIILKNKENLNNAIIKIKTSMEFILTELNSQTVNSNNSNNQIIMPNMGNDYDSGKMEQLHTWLYKYSVGITLLEQLYYDLDKQEQSANVIIQDYKQYYTDQYNFTEQNKSKLLQALKYINESANLTNINDYIFSDKVIVDQDIMTKTHNSIINLAEGAVLINTLSDDFNKQSMNLVSYIQNLNSNMNNTANNTADQTSHAAMTSNSMSNPFSNIDLSSVIYIIMIIFVAGLIIGIIGYIFNLSKKSKTESKEVINNQITI